MSIDWNIVVQSIIVSAIIAVVFSGGTNYFLQKRNRRANILYEKGYELIDKIYSVNSKRIEASFYVTLVHNVPEEKMNQVYSDYMKDCLEFNIEVKKRSVFLNKKINRKLEEFMSYLKEVEIAIENNLKGENYSINFNQKEEELCNQIIRLIKSA